MNRYYFHKHISHPRLDYFNSHIRKRVQRAGGIRDLEDIVDDADAIAREWDTEAFPLITVFYTCDAEIEIEHDVGQGEEDDDDDGDILVPA